MDPVIPPNSDQNVGTDVCARARSDVPVVRKGLLGGARRGDGWMLSCVVLLAIAFVGGILSIIAARQSWRGTVAGRQDRRTPAHVTSELRATQTCRPAASVPLAEESNNNQKPVGDDRVAEGNAGARAFAVPLEEIMLPPPVEHNIVESNLPLLPSSLPGPDNHPDGKPLPPGLSLPPDAVPPVPPPSPQPNPIPKPERP